MNINLLLLNFVLEICAYQTNTLDALEAAIANAVAEVSKRKSAQDQAINGKNHLYKKFLSLFIFIFNFAIVDCFCVFLIKLKKN